MSNVRPWFRFSSVARPSSQGSTDPPPPQPLPTPRRPVIVRPPEKQPPPPQEQSPYYSPPSRHMSPPQPRSSYTPPPSPKEVQEALPLKTPNSPPSTTHSTRTIKFELESSHQKVNSPQRVLSPYSLPPSQLHFERQTTHKNILTSEKTSQIHEPNHHNHQGNNTKKNHHHPSSSEFDNIMNTRVITISGENKGAVMEILRSPPSNKIGGSGTHSSRILNGFEEKGQRLQSSNSNEGEDEKKKTKNPNNIGNNSNVFMNSNVQMINSSIVYNSTAIHHDPGIHLKIFRKTGSSNGFHVKDGGYTPTEGK